MPVSPSLCCEPITVSAGAWERESRQADSTVRGTRSLTVRICCDNRTDAETTARAVARDLSGFDFAHAPP
ncbi:MAG: hypothetical protein LKE27_07500 [Atopobiaceae bacterium]|nr:hypothetical protein [Atopobiaceae bacterium]